MRINDLPGGGIEHISIDKDVVDRGDVVNWTATDLIIGDMYRVGIYVVAQNVVYNPIKFKADSKVKMGQYVVPSDIPYGQHKFVLQVWEEDFKIWRTADYKLITVAPKGIPKIPKIKTNKSEYVVGETLIWTAFDLNVCNRYRVGLMKNGTIITTISEFHADSEVKNGMYVIKEQPNSYMLVLIEFISATNTWKVVSQVPIVIKLIPAEEEKTEEEKKKAQQTTLIVLGVGIVMVTIGTITYILTRK
jgi:transcription antitermination factor NusG